MSDIVVNTKQKKAAESVTFWVTVKGRVTGGKDTLWSKQEDLQDLVMAVPHMRLKAVGLSSCCWFRSRNFAHPPQL